MNKQELIQLLNTLTLDDKITMIHGASMFQTGAVTEKNVPAFTFDDGPMGPRKEYQKDAWIPIGGMTMQPLICQATVLLPLLLTENARWKAVLF